MKKILLFAAACAALVACNISNIDKERPDVDGNAFVKGQRVTLTVGNGIGTKAAGTLDGDDISFTWTKGDQILVTVEGQSATFTLKGNGGSASGEFEGVMPGSGTTFSAQYPATDPDLATQTYDPSHAIASGLMKATATGCTVGSPVELKPEYAVLRLNLYADCTIGKIEVTDKTANPEQTYTLTCTGGVQNTSGNPTLPFFIVMPEGERNFEAKVYRESETPSIICIHATTEAKTFEKGKVLNMGLKYDYPGTDLQKISITTGSPATTTVWAPVNCGYVPKTGDSGAALGYPYGKLYQWGRKDGQGYNSDDATYPSETNRATGPISDIQEVSAEKFYKTASLPCNWYSGSNPAANDLWKEDGSSIYDPCPDGWRVPTDAEITALLGSRTGGALQDGNHGSLTDIQGKYFDGSTAASPTSGVFLPAAGYRTPLLYGIQANRGRNGYYWSSSVFGDNARALYFSDGYAGMGYGYRAEGYSVRCVQK